MTGLPYYRWRIGFELRLIARRLLRPLHRRAQLNRKARANGIAP